MKFKLEFKDLYGQKVNSESSKRIIFNTVKDPRTKEDVYYRVYANKQYNKISKEQYDMLKDFIQDEHKIIELAESTSYIFRGRVDDDNVVDKGREIYLGKENYDNLCVKISLGEDIKTAYIFEEVGEDIILQNDDYTTIQEIVASLKADEDFIPEEIIEVNNEVEDMEMEEEGILEEDIHEEKEEKPSISDFINNLKAESLSKAIKNKK